MKPLTVAIIAPYSYQPFRSIRQLCSLFERELQTAGLKTQVLVPASFFGDLFGQLPVVGKFFIGLEQLFISPLLMGLHLQGLQRKAKKEGQQLVVLISDQALASFNFSLRNFKVATFVSDLISIRAAMGEFPQRTLSYAGRYQQGTILSGLSAAQLLIANSTPTANDIKRIIPTQAEVVRIATLPLHATSYYALEADKLVAAQAALWRKQGLLQRAYILHVGSSAWYKNRQGVIRAAAALKQINPTAPSMVFAGERLTADELDLLKTLKVDFYYFENLTDEELNVLYQGADVMLFPSLEEGFGWPVLEALAAGTLVAIPAGSALESLFGSACEIIDAPASTDEWAQTTARTLESLLNIPAAARATHIAQGRTFAASFTSERFRTDLRNALESL